MTSTDFKPGSIDELVTMIYEDNLAHFEFMENMNGGDCDCNLHQTMNTIVKYWGEQYYETYLISMFHSGNAWSAKGIKRTFTM